MVTVLVVYTRPSSLREHCVRGRLYGLVDARKARVGRSLSVQKHAVYHLLIHAGSPNTGRSPCLLVDAAQAHPAVAQSLDAEAARRSFNRLVGPVGEQVGG